MLKLIRITCQAARHGKTELGINLCLNLSKSLAKPLVNGKTELGINLCLNLSESLAKPLVMSNLNMAYLSSLKNRAKLLLSSLPVSPSRVVRASCTSLYQAPSGHVVQAWAIPPPSWCLLSQRHQQQTTMPETNKASSAWTQQHS